MGKVDSIKEGLTDWLSRISDRAWVGVQCLVARTDSYETQRHILVYGLKESDAQAKRSEHGDSSTGAALVTWNWWVKLRRVARCPFGVCLK